MLTGLDAPKDLVTGTGDAVCELLSIGLLVVRLEFLLNVLVDGFAAVVCQLTDPWRIGRIGGFCRQDLPFVGERHVDDLNLELGVCEVFV